MMIDLKQDFFSDTEITSLLQDGGEDGNQTVEDFLYALFSLYEPVPDGKPLSKAFPDVQIMKKWLVIIFSYTMSSTKIIHWFMILR